MAWTNLKTNYKNASWSGNKKYMQTVNPDGTVSFEDRTQYTNLDASFIGAEDVNAICGAINTIMQSTLDAFPVGSVLLTTSDVNPATVFPNQTWVDVTDKYGVRSTKTVPINVYNGAYVSGSGNVRTTIYIKDMGKYTQANFTFTSATYIYNTTTYSPTSLTKTVTDLQDDSCVLSMSGFKNGSTAVPNYSGGVISLEGTVTLTGATQLFAWRRTA